MMSGLEEEELGWFLLWSCYNFILDYLDVDWDSELEIEKMM